jgi:hypothetical protein
MSNSPHPKLKQKPPHAFVLEALAPLNPEVRRMFSGFAVYLGDLIVCMLRDHEKSPSDNGIWLVLSDTVNPTDPELRREFPSLRPIGLIGNKIGHWMLIPSDGPTLKPRHFTHVICCCVAIRAWAGFQHRGDEAAAWR